MALNPKLSLASRNLALNAALDVLNGGGFLRIYDGVQPVDADTALGSQVKLAELALSSTAFAAAAGGSKTANAITSANALATSTATWASFVKSDGTTRVFECSVGLSGANVNHERGCACSRRARVGDFGGLVSAGLRDALCHPAIWRF
jgi:hypothetical protein